MDLALVEVPLAPGVRAVFTGADGGVSQGPWRSLNLGTHVGDEPAAVAENRRRVAQALGAPVRWVNQVHGCTVHDVDREAGLAAPSAIENTGMADADAQVTTHLDVPLGILVADCVPVLLSDESGTVVAAAHAGRAGVVSGVIARTLDAMRERGARRVHATVGPCICAACYEVPADLREQVARSVPVAWAVSAAGTPALDLRAAVDAQLSAGGVAQVTHVVQCTRHDAGWFSYRRACAQGMPGGKTGRSAGIVMRIGRVGELP